MKEKKYLLKNTFIIFMGKASTQFVSILLLPLYTKVLSTAEYGIVDLIVTYAILISPIITLQLETATFRFLIDNRNNSNKQSLIITNSFIASIIISLFITLIFIFINLFKHINYFIYIVILTYCTFFSNYGLQVARGKGKNIDYSIASTIIGVSTILLNIFFLLFLNLGVIGMLLAQSIGNLLGFIYIFIKEKIYKNLSIKLIDKKIIYSLLNYSIPLIPNGLNWWIINISDRTIITIMLGVSSNGIYAISNKISTIVVQIYNVFNLSWTESVSLQIKNKNSDFFSDTFNYILELFISFGILLIAFVPIIFNIVVNNNYNDAFKYIPLLVLGTFFNIVSSFIGGIYIALKKTKSIALTSFWAGAINIIVNIFLINIFRIYAAAISTIISFALMSIYRYLDIQKYIKLKLKIKKITFLLIIFFISYMLYFNRTILSNIILIILSLLVFLMVNGKFIRKIFYTFKKRIR